MTITAKEYVEILVQEVISFRAKVSEKSNLAWKQVIFSISIPVSIASLNFTQITFLDQTFIILAGSLISGSIMAYAFYLYLEVSVSNKYIVANQKRINTICESDLINFEKDFDPWYNKNDFGIPIIFTIFILVVLFTIIFSIVNYIDVNIISNKDNFYFHLFVIIVSSILFLSIISSKSFFIFHIMKNKYEMLAEDG